MNKVRHRARGGQRRREKGRLGERGYSASRQYCEYHILGGGGADKARRWARVIPPSLLTRLHDPACHVVLVARISALLFPCHRRLPGVCSLSSLDPPWFASVPPAPYRVSVSTEGHGRGVGEGKAAGRVRPFAEDRARVTHPCFPTSRRAGRPPGAPALVHPADGLPRSIDKGADRRAPIPAVPSPPPPPQRPPTPLGATHLCAHLLFRCGQADGQSIYTR